MREAAQDIMNRRSQPLLEAVGSTPFVPIATYCPPNGSRLYGKCEYLNPTGSHKDRLYLHAIRALEAAGTISPGMTLVDFSSGNAGTSLAFCAALLGYSCLLVRPQNLSKMKLHHMQALGACVELTPLSDGVPGARERARSLVAQMGDDAHLMWQTQDPLNIEAFQQLGIELVDDCRGAILTPTHFVCGIGTGGTFSGAMRILRRQYPQLRGIAVEVQGQHVISNRLKATPLEPQPHNIEGLSTGELYENTDLHLVDDVIAIAPEAAWQAAKDLARENGTFVGPSSGAAAVAFNHLARSTEAEITAITVLFDAGWKYALQWADSDSRSISKEAAI